jgi:hypothetical protein
VSSSLYFTFNNANPCIAILIDSTHLRDIYASKGDLSHTIDFSIFKNRKAHSLGKKEDLTLRVVNWLKRPDCIMVFPGYQERNSGRNRRCRKLHYNIDAPPDEKNNGLSLGLAGSEVWSVPPYRKMGD